jgi:ElaB/YqjD/DUF883 family membrane-anchored ribosome-binding protein
MEHTSSEKLSEALKLLEEAAVLKRDELKNAMADKYTHLKHVIVETESGLAKTIADAKRRAVDAAAHAKDACVAKTCEIGREVDQTVHQNPWPFIAGAAGVGLLLGYILARNRR